MSDRKALLIPSGVTPGSYGSASQSVTISVDAQGRVTSASATTISGNASWSNLTDPGGNTSLAMAANTTTLTWAGNYSTNSAFKLAGNNTSASGPLLHLTTAVSNNMPPLLVEPRTGQSLKCDHLQNVIVGKGDLGASDTDGFLYVPKVNSNGQPSGTPTAVSGWIPMVFEQDAVSAEYKLWAYLNGAWKSVTFA